MNMKSVQDPGHYNCVPSQISANVMSWGQYPTPSNLWWDTLCHLGLFPLGVFVTWGIGTSGRGWWPCKVDLKVKPRRTVNDRYYSFDEARKELGDTFFIKKNDMLAQQKKRQGPGCRGPVIIHGDGIQAWGTSTQSGACLDGCSICTVCWGSLWPKAELDFYPEREGRWAKSGRTRTFALHARCHITWVSGVDYLHGLYLTRNSL